MHWRYARLVLGLSIKNRMNSLTSWCSNIARKCSAWNNARQCLLYLHVLNKNWPYLDFVFNSRRRPLLSSLKRKLLLSFYFTINCNNLSVTPTNQHWFCHYPTIYCYKILLALPTFMLFGAHLAGYFSEIL